MVRLVHRDAGIVENGRINSDGYGRKPIVCYVTDRKALGRPPWNAVLERIRAAVAAGVDWVQIREKDLPARELLHRSRARPCAPERGASLS